jgi:hypothetical protein
MDFLIDLLHAWNVLGAMDVRFHDRYHHPPLRTAPRRRSDILSDGFRRSRISKKLIILNDSRASIDVEPDLAFGEIHEEKAHVRILGNIAKTRHHSVTSVLRIRKSFIVKHANESRQSCAKRSVRFSVPVGSSNKHHFLFGDESLHQGVEIVEYLMPIKGKRARRCIPLFLKLMLSIGPREGNWFDDSSFLHNGSSGTTFLYEPNFGQHK